MPAASVTVKVKKTVVTRVTTVRKVTVETSFRFAARVCRSCDACPGIARNRRGDSFVYRDARGGAVSAETIARIKALVIPPAWERVWICPTPGGHIQATGWDVRGRKQYRYHPAFRARKDDEKFDRLLPFARALPRLRARVRADLALSGLPREKVLAAVVRLLDRTYLRVGNPEYQRTNKSFGLSTLQDRHVAFPAGAVRVQFRGKSGVWHDRTVADQRLATVVRRCRDIPGQHLFQYRDGDGKARRIGSADVNRYVRRAANGEFTAKDFRTWAGTVSAAARFAGEERPPSEKAAERAVSNVIRQVAAELGNTPAVCRKSYVHPKVIDAFATGGLPEGRSRSGLSKDETRVLSLLD